MRTCVLFASPRGEDSNTLALLRVFLGDWRAAGHEAEVFSLYDLSIAPCRACRACQTDHAAPACAIRDDMEPIFQSILRSDLIVLASPVYSWYCTAPLKAAMDRMIYALCKFYGKEKGPSLLEGKAVAALATCGYRPEAGADLFDEGLRRWCKHGHCRYLGLHAQRHLGYDSPFMSEEKARDVRRFTAELMKSL